MTTLHPLPPAPDAPDPGVPFHTAKSDFNPYALAFPVGARHFRVTLGGPPPKPALTLDVTTAAGEPPTAGQVAQALAADACVLAAGKYPGVDVWQQGFNRRCLEHRQAGWQAILASLRPAEPKAPALPREAPEKAARKPVAGRTPAPQPEPPAAALPKPAPPAIPAAAPAPPSLKDILNARPKDQPKIRDPFALW